jgi:hypothetical protein
MRDAEQKSHTECDRVIDDKDDPGLFLYTSRMANH